MSVGQHQDISTVGVAGAGFMGSGIAEASARAGLAVHLKDRSGFIVNMLLLP